MSIQSNTYIWEMFISINIIYSNTFRQLKLEIALIPVTNETKYYQTIQQIR